jgi:hypothetical protein
VSERQGSFRRLLLRTIYVYFTAISGGGICECTLINAASVLSVDFHPDDLYITIIVSSNVGLSGGGGSMLLRLLKL